MQSPYVEVINNYYTLVYIISEVMTTHTQTLLIGIAQTSSHHKIPCNSVYTMYNGVLLNQRTQINIQRLRVPVSGPPFRLVFTHKTYFMCDNDLCQPRVQTRIKQLRQSFRDRFTSTSVAYG